MNQSLHLCLPGRAASPTKAEAALDETRSLDRGKEDTDGDDGIGSDEGYAEDNGIVGYGTMHPAHGEAWTEEQDLRVSWLHCVSGEILIWISRPTLWFGFGRVLCGFG